MYSELTKVVTKKEISFDRFYYAYCKKSPNEFMFSKVLTWSNVSEGLKEIIVDQLENIVKGSNKDTKFKGEPSGEFQEFEKKVRYPNGYVIPQNDTVINTLEKLLKNDLTDEEYRGCGDILALKYLSSTYSRTSVYGMIKFSVSINEETHKFIFVTLCDLLDEMKNLRLDVDKEELILEKIANVFKEQRLTKGILYPYIDSQNLDNKNLLLYDKESTIYWSNAFECKHRLPATVEREIFNGMVKNYLLDPNSGFIPRNKFETITQKTADIPHQRIELKEVEKMFVSKLRVKYDFSQIAKVSEGYQIAKNNIYNDKKDYTVKMDKIEVKLNQTDLSRVHQVEIDGKYLLIIEGFDKAKIEEFDLPVEITKTEDFLKKFNK